MSSESPDRADASVSDARMGGSGKLRVVAVAAPDIDGVLGGEGAGSLAEAVRAEHGDVDVDVQVIDESAWVAALENGSPPDALDVVLLGLEPLRSRAVEDATERLRRTVVLTRERTGAHVLVLNGSTVDPADRTTNYHGQPTTPTEWVARLDRFLVDLSAETGISIVDADRILAELGAGAHVEAIMRYSDRAHEALRVEVVRILADYGFFEARPLMQQIGASGR